MTKMSQLRNHDKIVAINIHNDDVKFERKSDENEQNVKTSIHNLSQICDEILIAKN